MGQSLYQAYVHIIFSTKYREPLITEEFEDRVHAYIGGICNEMGSIPLEIGGYDDHVHILCKFPKDITLMELVKKIKGNSSKWIKSLDPQFANFYWQSGYGAFSVGISQIRGLRKYIKNQRQHHSKQENSFKKEFVNYLIENEIEFEEKYLWD